MNVRYLPDQQPPVRVAVADLPGDVQPRVLEQTRVPDGDNVADAGQDQEDGGAAGDLAADSGEERVGAFFVGRAG